ncbi:uncharacterized protein BCN122_I1398 [Burkholderia cenocepacia]|nr:uncharacterized protein BCN122_I1398 [Burkholderia cenocepacia]
MIAARRKCLHRTPACGLAFSYDERAPGEKFSTSGRTRSACYFTFR